MEFYDINTFCVADYPKADCSKLEILVDKMNDYARLTLNAVDGLPQRAGGGYDFGYEKFYTEKYGPYKTPDVVMQDVVDYVSENKDMVKPCLSMFDRLQERTGYSNPCAINEMLHAMADIGKAFPEFIPNCKRRVEGYSVKYFNSTGQLPAQAHNVRMLIATRAHANSELSNSDTKEVPEGVKVSKPNRNRWLEICGLKRGNKNK